MILNDFKQHGYPRSIYLKNPQFSRPWKKLSRIHDENYNRDVLEFVKVYPGGKSSNSMSLNKLLKIYVRNF